MHVTYTHYLLHMDNIRYIYIYMYNVHTLFMCVYIYIYTYTHIYTRTHIVYVCYPSPKNASSKKAKILFFHHCKPRV